MQKLNFANAAASRPQTLDCTPNVAPPTRTRTALSVLAGQVENVLTELLAADAYRAHVPPQVRRDVGYWG